LDANGACAQAAASRDHTQSITTIVTHSLLIQHHSKCDEGVCVVSPPMIIFRRHFRPLFTPPARRPALPTPPIALPHCHRHFARGRSCQFWPPSEEWAGWGRRAAAHTSRSRRRAGAVVRAACAAQRGAPFARISRGARGAQQGSQVGPWGNGGDGVGRASRKWRQGAQGSSARRLGGSTPGEGGVEG